MNKIVQELIEEAVANESDFLDLGNCGLTEIPEELADLPESITHLSFGSFHFFIEKKFSKSKNHHKKNEFSGSLESFDILSSLSFVKTLELYACSLKKDHLNLLSQLTFLKQFNLSYNQLSEAGDIGNLANLTSLNISHNKLSEAGNIAKLTNLTSLNISGNKLSEAGDIEKLSSLTSLDISHNKLSEVGNIAKLTNLTSLNISGNKLSEAGDIEKLSSLTSLDISHNKLSEVGNIAKLTNLTSLDISDNKLSEAGDIGNLNNLTYLDISGNQLTEAGNIAKLTNLTSLNISTNQLTEAGDIGNLANLTSLFISNNKLSEAGSIGNLANLTTLFISNNQLTEVGDIGKLSSLASLFISSNQLSKAGSIGNLTNLTDLFISNNQLTEAGSIENLANLTYLNISYNQLSKAGSVGNLTNLTSLNISSNQLSKAGSVGNLTNLTSLNISSNQLSKAGSVGNLTNLTSLNISNNQLSEAGSIENLANLTSLNISGNQLSKAGSVGNLTNLTDLDISSNQLSKAGSIGNLTNLTDLDISSNQLSKAGSIGNLTNLTDLDISNNQLSSTMFITQLNRLIEIQIYNNPTRDCPEFIIEQYNCQIDLRLWWKELDEAEEIKTNELVKVQVLGNGNSGKSSIIEALEKGRCTRKFDSTHGVVILLVPFKVDGETITLQVWDFGGQEIYHGTHRLFISSQSIQLLVADDETELSALNNKKEPDRINSKEFVRHQPLQHYINLSTQQSRNSERLVVKNKIEQDIHEPSNNIYIEAARNRFTYCEVSAHKGKGITVLRSQIAEMRDKIRHFNMPMPVSWINTRDCLLNNISRTPERRRRTISKRTFTRLCKFLNVNERATEAVLNFLHHTGVVYKNETYLGDIIILDQQWALEAIYRPLDRESDFYDDLKYETYGKVRIKKLFRAFGDEYEIEHKWMFLDFMRSCGLCLPITEKDEPLTENDYLVFPEFLPEEETDTVKNMIASSENIRVFVYSPEYLDYFRIQHFIVRLGNKTSMDNIWKYGIAFPTQKSVFKVEFVNDLRSIKISIESSIVDEYLWLIIDTLSSGIPMEKESEFWFNGDNSPLDIAELRKRHEQLKSPHDQEDLEILENVTKHKAESLLTKLPDKPQKPLKRLVISFASEDIPHLKDILPLLHSRYLSTRLEVLYDKKVIDGTKVWDDQIEEMFNDADGYLILLSNDYQSSEKEFIWKKEIPIIKKRLKNEGIPTFGLIVRPVSIDPNLSRFATFTGGNKCLPESGHAREQFLVDFVEDMIKSKFLSDE